MNHEQMQTWILLTFSAVLYPIPFYYPQTFFWVSFLYLVPLLYAASRNQLSWQQGYVWGFIALNGHEAGIFWGLFNMAEGAFWVRLLPILFLMFYCPLFSAFWFFITERLSKICQSNKPVCRVVIWVITAWLYQLWMNYCQLWPFGACEGNVFLNPLITFTEYPPLLVLLPLLGVSGLTAYLFACSGMITCALIKKTGRGWGLAAIAFLPWVLGFLHVEKQILPAWVTKIGVVQQQLYSMPDKPAALLLQECCAALQQQFPAITTVLCPESALYDTDIDLKLQAYASACSAAPVQLLFGGFSDIPDDEKHRNTAYFVDADQSVRRFFKRHTMPLTEQMPPWFDVARIRELFFARRPQIARSCNLRPLWVIAGQSLVPYICSELFFNHARDDHYSHVPIIALCNDLWAPAPVRRQMYLGARLRAQEWQRDIVYVSYYYAMFIAKNGFTCHLQTISDK